MALIRGADIVDDKKVDHTELDKQVLIFDHKYQLLEDSIGRIEKRIDQMIEQTAATKKTVITVAVALVTGICSTVFAILMEYFKR